MPDPFEEKSERFLPRESYFWILNTVGWIATLHLMNPGYALSQYPEAERPAFLTLYLAVIWLAYYVLGTLTLLVFRRCYYRQRWYRKTFLGSLPLVLVVALAGGMAMAFLVNLPMDLLRGGDFRIHNEAGIVVYEGVLSTTLYGGYERALIMLLWLLAYLGIEGALNARSLALKALVLEGSLREAQLNALAGQINPHFLFNALNNIRFMIRRDAARAEESLVDLAEILRHSLQVSLQEKALLSEELIIVERYLGLMKIQMQSRLDYSIQAGGVPQKVLVPPMIIQMLAENAVKHGIEKTREGGRVDIVCSMTAGKLRIDVSNSIAPVDSGNETAAVKGVGLANIGKRLALLYGGAAQLSMSRRNDEFLVHIEIPGEEAV